MNSLTVHEVEQLVALRLSLEDALSRAKGATKYRRGTAIVALDATVERASSIVAVTRSLSIPTNGKLEDLISRLRESFGSSWKPAVLPDIRHLRRARNASQHEGLEPDREQVPVWASAAKVYVSSLIEAQFAVDILRVVLSDAIRDPDLRQFIRKAETARAAGEPGACVDIAKEAYREVSMKWTRLHGNRRPAFPPTSSELIDKKSYDFVNGRIDNATSRSCNLMLSLTGSAPLRKSHFLGRGQPSGNAPPVTANRSRPRNLAIPYVVPQPPPQSAVTGATL